jgi:hypothetical protein
MNPPFHTGKVRIGCAYQPALRVPMDRDAIRLQDALLCNARRTDWDGIVIVLGTLAAIGAVAWVMA